MAATTEKRYKWRRGDYREKTKGLLMLNTGDGKGKTTAGWSAAWSSS
jgi:ATP:corrinoid adenosyltransferase